MTEGFEAPDGAIITLNNPDGSVDLQFQAVILIDYPEGFGWIEPSYLSPDYPGRSGHRLRCAVARLADGTGFSFVGEYSGTITKADNDRAIQFVHRKWVEKGRNLETEREYFRNELLL